MSADHIELGKVKRNAVISAYKSFGAAAAEVSGAVNEFVAFFGNVGDVEALQLLVQLPMMAGAATATAPSKEEIKTVKKKIAKDPNAPKRPASAFIQYQNTVRDTFRAQNPDLPYKDVMSLIAASWAQLPTDERKAYTDVVAAKTAIYDLEKEAYEKTAGPAAHLDATAAAAEEALTTPAPKKRARKSAAEKTAEAEVDAAKAVETLGVLLAKPEKKLTKKAAAAAAKVAAAAAEPESSVEDETDDSEADQVVVPVAAKKGKKAVVVADKEEPKKKKSKAN